MTGNEHDADPPTDRTIQRLTEAILRLADAADRLDATLTHLANKEAR